jgi:hypothetical protein
MSQDWMRFYHAFINQKQRRIIMKVNTRITGIHLHEYETDMPDGTPLGFDADFGDMVAYQGKLIPTTEYMENSIIVIIEQDFTEDCWKPHETIVGYVKTGLQKELAIDALHRTRSNRFIHYTSRKIPLLKVSMELTEEGKDLINYLKESK